MESKEDNEYHQKIRLLRIVTWNCNGAFRKKFEKISELNADIYVIQECEDPSQINHKDYQNWSINHLWIGDNKNKGIGIFARQGIVLEFLDWSNKYKDHFVKYFLPCRINQKFNLLGVWAHRNDSPNFGYIGQVWKYLQINRENLRDSVIVGDFNSNVIWDQWDRWWNHSDVLKEFQELSLESLYHHYFKESQGKETQPTLHFRKSLERSYHIDYVFASNSFISELKRVEIGKQMDWIYASDHMPLICDFT